jgi:hypothetical protein
MVIFSHPYVLNEFLLPLFKHLRKYFTQDSILAIIN